MAVEPVRVSKAVPRIRRDGVDVEITFESATRRKAVVVIEREKLSGLIEALIRMFETAAHSAAVGEEAKRRREPGGEAREEPPLLYHVQDLTLAVYPDSDATTIRAKTLEGPEVQMAFQPAHLQFLFHSLRRSGTLPPDPAVH